MNFEKFFNNNQETSHETDMETEKDPSKRRSLMTEMNKLMEKWTDLNKDVNKLKENGPEIKLVEGSISKIWKRLAGNELTWASAEETNKRIKDFEEKETDNKKEFQEE